MVVMSSLVSVSCIVTTQAQHTSIFTFSPLLWEAEDVVGALTPVGRGAAQVFHDLLGELRLLLVAGVEEGEEEDRQEESWEVESGVQGEEVAHMDGMWMECANVSVDDQGK